MQQWAVGIDIGTGSVRAALVNVSDGRIATSHVHPIQVWEPKPGYFEQSSTDIYAALCECVAKVTEGVTEKESVIGIGIDATCSLVVVTNNDRPVSISPTGEQERNIILWADHRAVAQAEAINATRHPVLEFVGGTISPEMETPKLLWIKENLPKVFERDDVFYFDLADYFTWKLSGCEDRSTCTTVCKWTFVAGSEGSPGHWDESYFRQVGLFDKLGKDSFRKIGKTVRPMGELAGRLTEKAAKELGGLSQTTSVAIGMIDAHAAGIGIVGADTSGYGVEYGTHERLALIAGTSCCHMAVAREKILVPGVWGPYKDAMIPGFYLAEGGQSAVGKAIDHVVKSHPAYSKLLQLAEDAGEGTSKYDVLNKTVEKLAASHHHPNVAMVAREVHVLPYFHGNRSPRADPSLKGVVSGLTISDTVEDLAVTYLATIQGLAYDTKHIIDTLNGKGYEIRAVFVCGGLKNNPLYVSQHVDVLQMPLFISAEEHSACVGASILGATAAGHFSCIEDGMRKMNRVRGQVKMTKDDAVIEFHRRKYAVFHKMYEHQMELRQLMMSKS